MSRSNLVERIMLQQVTRSDAIYRNADNSRLLGVYHHSDYPRVNEIVDSS